MTRILAPLALGAIAGVVIAAGLALYAIDLAAAPLRWVLERQQIPGRQG